jgi:hypothetical protein
MHRLTAMTAGAAGEFLGYWDAWKCDDNNTLWVNK